MKRSHWITCLATDSTIVVYFINHLHIRNFGIHSGFVITLPNIAWLIANTTTTTKFENNMNAQKTTYGIFHTMGLLADTLNGRFSMHRECREHFLHHRLQRKPLISDPSMHHGMWHAVMHVGFTNQWWLGKCSHHSRCMHNLQFYVSSKRPM